MLACVISILMQISQVVNSRPLDTRQSPIVSDGEPAHSHLPSAAPRQLPNGNPCIYFCPPVKSHQWESSPELMHERSLVSTGAKPYTTASSPERDWDETGRGSGSIHMAPDVLTSPIFYFDSFTLHLRFTTSTPSPLSTTPFHHRISTFTLPTDQP